MCKINSAILSPHIYTSVVFLSHINIRFELDQKSHKYIFTFFIATHFVAFQTFYILTNTNDVLIATLMVK